MTWSISPTTSLATRAICHRAAPPTSPPTSSASQVRAVRRPGAYAHVPTHARARARTRARANRVQDRRDGRRGHVDRRGYASRGQRPLPGAVVLTSWLLSHDGALPDRHPRLPIAERLVRGPRRVEAAGPAAVATEHLFARLFPRASCAPARVRAGSPPHRVLGSLTVPGVAISGAWSWRQEHPEPFMIVLQSILRRSVQVRAHHAPSVLARGLASFFLGGGEGVNLTKGPRCGRCTCAATTYVGSRRPHTTFCVCWPSVAGSCACIPKTCVAATAGGQRADSGRRAALFANASGTVLQRPHRPRSWIRWTGWNGRPAWIRRTWSKHMDRRRRPIVRTRCVHAHRKPPCGCSVPC